MGYDMNTVIKPEGEERAVARVQEALSKAYAEQDAFPKEAFGKRDMSDWEQVYGPGADPACVAACERASKLYDDLREVERSYFRLNIWGMGNVCTAMLNLGMAYESLSERTWPEIPGDWESAAGELKREHPAGGSTIPVHKFGSNDGWIVTPAECLEALAAWHAHTEGERDDALSAAGIDRNDPAWAKLWRQWLAFLELAAHCEGFEVH